MTRTVWLWLIVLLVACDSAKEPAAASGSASGSAVATASGGGSGSALSATPIDAGAALDASVAAAAVDGYEVGDLVSAKWDDGYWYPGKIGAVNDDGTYTIKYSDGDVGKHQKAKNIKPRKPSTGGGTSSSGGCGSGHMKCGGSCVDYLNDANNCNACGRTCPEACMGGSCVSNAYKYGN